MTTFLALLEIEKKDVLEEQDANYIRYLDKKPSEFVLMAFKLQFMNYIILLINFHDTNIKYIFKLFILVTCSLNGRKYDI